MERDTIIVRFIPADKWYHSAMWELMEGYESVNGEVHVPEGFKTDDWYIYLRINSHKLSHGNLYFKQYRCLK